MNKILVVTGHPYWPQSRANRIILDEITRIAAEKGNDYELSLSYTNITELYPDGRIDVPAEQQKLLAANVVVFPFPVMWFAAPSPVHRYMEEVLTYGFAYGPEGTNLRNKAMLASVTAGGDEASYQPGGKCPVTMDQIMASTAAVASYCLMKWGGYLCSYSAADRSEAELRDHARRLIDTIRGLG